MSRIMDLITKGWKKSVVKPSFTNETITIPKDDTHVVIKKLRKGVNVTLPDLNLLLSDVYNSKAITTTHFKLQEVILKDAVFEMKVVRYLETEKGDDAIVFEMEEVTHGIKAAIHIAPEDFQDFFREYKLKGNK